VAGTATSTDTYWYKDAVIYEVHVRAFADSNGDGIGDFRGLIGKLDYLRDLGVTAIWLLPFFPSPLLDDGYDISNYTGVNPAYGTIDDFREFLEEAHDRDLRVIVELVLNHTSDQHPWFQRARNAPAGSDDRAFYVWSDSPDRYADARVIFSDFEDSNWTWDPVAGAWFWHRFYSHQPDLNWAHPPVREAMFDVVDFWLGLGVDGLRLDAVPYLIEAEGTSSENLPGTHAVLRELRARIDARYDDRMLLAEANQWPEDAVAYFGNGDECHMAFHFPLMPRLFMAVQTQDRLPITDILDQTPAIPEPCQWALFLRNHDELTLEMVAEEERMAMYRAFAPSREERINLGIRRRLAPLLDNSRRRIELLNALLCSMPGTPVVYYGDEIGMGDNVQLGDRDGVRTPMQWNSGPNAGFSTASPDKLYLPLVEEHEYHPTMLHVEAQEHNSHSLLAFMRRLLALRKRHPAFGRGAYTCLQPVNPHVLAFLRHEETLLVVANLSRFGQAVELDLRAHARCTSVELFGRTPFWPIGDDPYRLTLGPHAFQWFALVDDVGKALDSKPQRHPVRATDGWESVLERASWPALAEELPAYLERQLWFVASMRSLLSVGIEDVIRLTAEMVLILGRAGFSEDQPMTFLIPVRIAGEDERVADDHIVAVVSTADGPVTLVDAIADDSAATALRDAMARESIGNQFGRIVPSRMPGVDAATWELPAVTTETAEALAKSGEEAPHLVIKALRRIGAGVSPEWELGQALATSQFRHVPEVVGALTYESAQGWSGTVAVAQRYVPHGESMRDVLAADAVRGDVPAPDVLKLVRLAGQRVGELQVALAGGAERASMAPERVTGFVRRSMYQSIRSMLARTLRSLTTASLDAEDRAVAESVLAREAELEARFREVLDLDAAGMRVHTPGDVHLGQLLLAGGDLLIVDFDGAMDRPIDERQLKDSPLGALADLLYSVRYLEMEAGAAPTWGEAVRAALTEGYLEAEEVGTLIPRSATDRDRLLGALVLAQALWQVGYRLRRQDAGIGVALRVLADLLGTAVAA
jgi:maltose alpha-D-glucosyltransferase/alpha-amylase